MYLQLDTQFNPFTYDEMVKPLLYYKQAYDETEAAYSDLVSQTEAWSDVVNQQNSPEAYAMYQRFSNDLGSIVDDFSRGMTARNKGQLLNMKRRYARDITPIAKASEAMNAANALRDNAGLDAIFEVGRYNSLDDFLHGKTANNRYQSASAITKKVATMTEAAMAEAMQDPEFKEFLNGQQWLITQHTGGSYADLMAAIANNPQAQSKFAEIKKKVMQDMNINNFDAQGQLAIEDAINTGLYAGLDKPTRTFAANADHMNPLQKAQISASYASARHSDAQTELLRAQNENLKKGLKADGSPVTTEDRQLASKFAIIKYPMFFDTKNPHKSGYLKEYTDVKGTVITYSQLEGHELDKTIASKTGVEGRTLKEQVDADIKSMYPGANGKEIAWIANNYYTIHVEDNGNITLVPKNVSSMSPSGVGSGVNTNVPTADWQNP